MINGNKPAMPINTFEKDGAVSISTNEHTGLTKREMIAMHIEGHTMVSLNDLASKGEWDYPDFEVLAKQTVQFADSLLKELNNDDT